MDASFDQAAEDLWVFGYGSLIWRPGFDYLERAPANIIGMHRHGEYLNFFHAANYNKLTRVFGRPTGWKIIQICITLHSKII